MNSELTITLSTDTLIQIQNAFNLTAFTGTKEARAQRNAAQQEFRKAIIAARDAK